MNNTLKSIVIIILAVLVFVAAVKFLFWLAPFLIVAALIGYIVYKVKGISKNNEPMNNINQDNVSSYKTVDEDFSTGEVIEVDYEEVNNDKVDK